MVISPPSLPTPMTQRLQLQPGSSPRRTSLLRDLNPRPPPEPPDPADRVPLHRCCSVFLRSSPKVMSIGTPVVLSRLQVGNPLRRPTLSHMFLNLASDVGGNPLRRPALSQQKLVRSCCRRTTLTSSSVVESTSLPCLLSMNGEKNSDSFPSFSFSVLTGLLPCGAVCTGHEGAIETTLVFLVGEDCLSTSLVTISQLSDFVVKASSTHSSLALNSLSTSYEDLSCLVLFAIVVHELFSRGCLILSWLCSL
ncbi:hypothetical protein Bca4012_101802 [Brassica carinata]